MPNTIPDVIRFDIRTGAVALTSNKKIEIPWWRMLMMQNRISVGVSSLYSNPRAKAQELLELMKEYRLAIEEITSVAQVGLSRRVEALERALDNCYVASGGERPDPQGDDEDNVRNAYVILISSVISEEKVLLWLLARVGFDNREGICLPEMDGASRRGWYRIAYGLVKAYLIAMSTYYATVCFHLGNGADPDRLKIPYSVLTWSQLAELLDFNYSRQFGIYTSDTDYELESVFAREEFLKRYQEEQSRPAAHSIAELLMFAQTTGHIEQTLTPRDMLMCLANCNLSGVRLSRRDALYELSEILVATSLMPSEMILTLHPGIGSLYLDGGSADVGAVRPTEQNPDINIEAYNKAKVRAINMKSHYFATREAWAPAANNSRDGYPRFG